MFKKSNLKGAQFSKSIPAHKTPATLKRKAETLPVFNNDQPSSSDSEYSDEEDSYPVTSKSSNRIDQSSEETDDSKNEGEESNEDEDEEFKEDEDEESKDEESEGEEEQATRTAIRSELSGLTYEELEALKSKLGTKVYNEAMFGQSSSKHSGRKKKKEMFKRENKNRPRELSSRVRVRRVREVVHVKKRRVRDPRFENLCGELDPKLWKANYSFLVEQQKEENEVLAKKLKKQPDGQVNEMDEVQKQELAKYLTKMKNKERSDAANEKEIEKRQQLKLENKKRMQEGKKPYYVKKSTQKWMDLSEKYEELKASGGLDKFLKKKRKKNATRDRKLVEVQGRRDM